MNSEFSDKTSAAQIFHKPESVLIETAFNQLLDDVDKLEKFIASLKQQQKQVARPYRFDKGIQHQETQAEQKDDATRRTKAAQGHRKALGCWLEDKRKQNKC